MYNKSETEEAVDALFDEFVFEGGNIEMVKMEIIERMRTMYDIGYSDGYYEGKEDSK